MSSAAEAGTSSTSTTTEVLPAAPAAAPTHLTLKLRPARRRRVRFADEVVDNEELGRKKSKCCCQYHRPKAFDESSDEEDDPLKLLRGPVFPDQNDGLGGPGAEPEAP